MPSLTCIINYIANSLRAWHHCNVCWDGGKDLELVTDMHVRYMQSFVAALSRKIKATSLT